MKFEIINLSCRCGRTTMEIRPGMYRCPSCGYEIKKCKGNPHHHNLESASIFDDDWIEKGGHSFSILPTDLHMDGSWVLSDGTCKDPNCSCGGNKSIHHPIIPANIVSKCSRCTAPEITTGLMQGTCNPNACRGPHGYIAGSTVKIEML